MKIIVFALFICVEGILATEAHSQVTKVTIQGENLSILHILQEIEKQTDYLFVYNKKYIDVNRETSVHANGKTVAELLKELFKNTEVVYAMEGKNIMLLPKNELQHERTITGIVTDEKGEPVIGANIVEKGTANGTISDANGAFSLNLFNNRSLLLVSYIGYNSQEIDPGTEDKLIIRLTEDTQKLDEIIVVGYGTAKKVNLTGAVVQIDNKSMENRPVTNIGKALQGMIGNLNMSVSGAGGAPGSTMDYNIRGTTSLSGGSPLFIVDGVPADNINNINPSDVETLTVLKDAASAAIYGARAAYGVILVTTKSGAKDEKTWVSYNNVFGYNHATTVPNQVSSWDFANAYNVASLNSGQSPMFSEEHLARIKAYMEDPVHTPSNIPNPNNTNLWSYATLDNDNVDWFRAFFKPGTWNQKHDLNVKGGTAKSNYYIGAGYYRENGLLRYANDHFERFNFTSNLHYEPYKWLKGDVRVKFSRDRNNALANSYDGDIGNWVHLSTTRYPNWALKDPNGHWAATSHIYKQLDGGRTIDGTNVFSVTGALEIEPVKNWKINLDYTYRNTARKESTHAKPVIWEYSVSEDPIMTTSFDAFSTLQAQTNYNSFNAYTSYEKEIAGHFISFLIGQQLEVSKYDYLTAMRRNLINQDIPSLSTAIGTQTNDQQLTHWANMGTFIRANYNYQEKYLIEFNARYDGSSKFQRGNRFGFFPSVSVGYNIAREKFWTIENIVNSLKIRGSYGTLGNQNVADYLYLSTITVGNNYGYLIDGVRPSYLNAPGLVSRDLTWETVSTVDIGLDASFLSNQLNVSFDWYQRTTTDMFGPANALPAVLGASVPQENNADLRTSGFELNIGWRDRIGSDFSYNVNFVLSDYTSKVITYNNPTKLLSTYYEGQKLGEIWGYKTRGIIQTDQELQKIPDQSYIYGNWSIGDIEYRDLNNDHKIDKGKNTKDDHGDLTVIGNTTPRFSYGLTLGALWKGFDLNIFLQGVGKRDFCPPTGGNSGVFFWGFTGGFGSNMYKETSDFWTPENTNAYYPKPYNSSEVYKNQQPQTRYLQNAAYLRLKNFSLGYTLPETILTKIRLHKIRLFISGENLFTITSLQKNFDPELLNGSWGAGKIYPLSRTLSFGLNIDF
ncbi:TonB-dependent receptor [Parabacteroides pacaensis]|uniref:TonB-dependent receptor n=1 Tax=Parabacteroides pacaensis TaxID=2086575 RepID=UPI00131C3225|nr:TonB-dependent receptor [Parabacteroides pacaensis]